MLVARKVCLILSLLFLQRPMAAQADPRNTEIFGTIKDVAGAVVPGADVQIVTMEGKRLAGGVSNSAGAFRLTIPAIAGATLQITHKGFKPFITSIKVSRRRVSPSRSF